MHVSEMGYKLPPCCHLGTILPKQKLHKRDLGDVQILMWKKKHELEKVVKIVHRDRIRY